MVAIPSSGKQTRGNNAVTAIGNASVAYQIAINIPIAATLYASGGSPSGAGKKEIINAALGPKKRPIFWCNSGFLLISLLKIIREILSEEITFQQVL